MNFKTAAFIVYGPSSDLLRACEEGERNIVNLAKYRAQKSKEYRINRAIRGLDTAKAVRIAAIEIRDRMHGKPASEIASAVFRAASLIAAGNSIRTAVDSVLEGAA